MSLAMVTLINIYLIIVSVSLLIMQTFQYFPQATADSKWTLRICLYFSLVCVGTASSLWWTQWCCWRCERWPLWGWRRSKSSCTNGPVSFRAEGCCTYSWSGSFCCYSPTLSSLTPLLPPTTPTRDIAFSCQSMICWPSSASAGCMLCSRLLSSWLPTWTTEVLLGWFSQSAVQDVWMQGWFFIFTQVSLQGASSQVDLPVLYPLCLRIRILGLLGWTADPNARRWECNGRH